MSVLVELFGKKKKIKQSIKIKALIIHFGAFYVYLKKWENRLQISALKEGKIGLPKPEGHKMFGYASPLISHVYFMPLYINN